MTGQHDDPAHTRPTSAQVRRATRAVYVAFIASGFAFANWAARIPQVRDRLHVDPAELGLILLAMAIGSIIALPVAGLIVTRFGAARSVAVMSLILAVGLVTTAIGYRLGVPAVVVGLFLFGFGNGTWDVAMNVEGAAVEQHLGRAIMPRFHAGWSVGTVAGALLGSAMIALHVGVTAHLLVVAVIVGVAVPFAVRGFIAASTHTGPQAATPAATTIAGPAATDVQVQQSRPRHNPLKAWSEPRTLLIGVFVLCMAFTEGTGNDWLNVAMIDGYHAAPAVGSLTFAIFVAAMTTARWFGPALIDRYGRVTALRASAALALIGLVLVVFSGTIPTAMVGALLWGLGAALGFPVGMSAAGDDPRRAAGRVSVVASIGYTAFLAGPPLIGFLGNHFGVRHALTAAAALLAVAVLVAQACRPLPAEDRGATSLEMAAER
jgi:predicted MFS family arabinose efflux permease